MAPSSPVILLSPPATLAQSGHVFSKLGPWTASPGTELAAPAAGRGRGGRDGRDRRGWKVGRQGGGEGAGSSRERASEGKRRGGQRGPARALPRPFLSHKRRQRAHQPCPALRPPRCRRRAPRPRRPPPRPPGSLYFGEGRGGGDAGPGGLEGPNIAGCFGFAPLFPKSKSRNADRGAVRPRPGLTSLAPSAGSSDVRFPVRLVPDPVASRRHWLGQRRATSGTPSPDALPPPAARPRGSARGCAGRGRAGSSRAGRPRAQPRRARVLPPCTGCAASLWRVPCWPPRCSRVRARRPPPPLPSSRISASPRTRSRTRARPRWVRAARSGLGCGGTAGVGPPRTQNLAEQCVPCHLVYGGNKISELSASFLGDNFSLSFFTESKLQD